MEKKRYHGAYHDSIHYTVATPAIRAAEKSGQLRQVLDDLARRIPLPTDGRPVILTLRQECVEPHKCSALMPQMAQTRDVQVITMMDLEWTE